MNAKFSQTISKLLILIAKVQNLVNPLVNLLSAMVGKNSFYNLINCKFMGIDLKNVINVFSGTFSTTSQGIGIMIILISFFNFVSVVATIFMINYLYVPEGDKQSDQPQLELGKI